jgi:hypothetical protein
VNSIHYASSHLLTPLLGLFHLSVYLPPFSISCFIKYAATAGVAGAHVFHRARGTFHKLKISKFNENNFAHFFMKWATVDISFERNNMLPPPQWANQNL